MARRFGRRRKPSVVWMPPVGTQINSTLINGEQYAGGFFVGKLLLGANHNPTIEFPLVTDNPNPTEGLSTVFTDWTGQDLQLSEDVGYRLRRCVGKIHVGVRADETSSPSTRSNFISVTAGLIVRRVDRTGTAVSTEISTQTINSNRDPWIWRRNWILGTGHFLPDPNPMTAFDTMPFNNTVGYAGGNADAAHVDQKTARRIGPEERLFLDVSFVTGLQLTGQDELEEQINAAIHYDMRILASPFRSGTNRRNASR